MAKIERLDREMKEKGESKYFKMNLLVAIVPNSFGLR